MKIYENIFQTCTIRVTTYTTGLLPILSGWGLKVRVLAVQIFVQQDDGVGY